MTENPCFPLWEARKKDRFSTGNPFWTAVKWGQADKKSMSFQTSFKQILKEKMADHSSAPSEKQTSIHNTDPAHLSFLMSQIGRFDFQTTRNHYPRPKPRPALQRKPHEFSAGQKQSYEFFKTYIHDLSEGFTASELKKAFRQAALILHPDRGGTATQFMDLKTNYEILKTVSPAQPSQSEK